MINVRVLVVTAVAIGTFTCAQLPATAADAAQPGAWGVNVGAPFRGAGIKKLGAQWVRLSIGWSQVEHATKGSYDWGLADKTLSYYIDNGFHVICILSIQTLAPPYSADVQDKDTVSKAIARWMGAAAQRYKGKGIVWEIGNEPEVFPMGGYWNMAYIYVGMATQAATAIKQADPSAKVAALSMAWMDREYVSKAFRANLLSQGNIDYLSFHGYHRHTIEAESGLEDDIDWLRAQAAAATPAGKQAPEVIDSECGYSIVPFQTVKSKDSWRTVVYTEDAQAAYLARHYIEEIYLKVPISIWYRDMNGESQFSLYYTDDSDSRGLRPSGRVYAALSQLLPDSPAAMQNTQFAVTATPKASAADAAKALAIAGAAVSSSSQLHVRSFLRQNTAGQRVLIIAAWNAIEAFDGEILASRTFNGTQVSESWRAATASDPISVASRINIASLTNASIKSTQVTTFQHGSPSQQTGKLDATANGKSIDLSLTSTPTIVQITFSGGPGAPSGLRVTQ
jgi:cellulase (glycosyl hydrolase family 5)